MFQHCFNVICAIKGLLYAFSSAVLVACMDVSMRFVMESVNPLEALWVRSLTFCSCTVLYFMCKKEFHRLKEDTRNEWKLLVTRSVFSTICTICLIYSMTYIDVGSAVALYNTMPIFTGFIALVLLKEPYTYPDFFLSIVSLTGVVFISKPQLFIHVFDSDINTNLLLYRMFGVLIGLACGVTSAVSFTLSGLLLKRNVHSLTIQTFYGLVFAVSMSVLTFTFPSLSIPSCGLVRLLLFATGFLNFLVQIGFTNALKTEKAVHVTMVVTSSIPVTFLFQFAFLKMSPDFFSASGSLLILMANVGIALMKNYMTSQTKAGDERRQNDEQLKYDTSEEINLLYDK